MVATVVGIVSTTIVARRAIGIVVPALESAIAASIAASSFTTRTESAAVAMTVTTFAALKAAFATLETTFAALAETATAGLLVVVVRDSFFSSDRRAFVLYTVECFEGLTGLFVVQHLDKTVTFGTAGFAVHNYFGRRNFSELLEKSLQRFRSRVRGKLCGKNFHQCKLFRNK